MEARVAAMEAEIRALKRAVAAVAENVLRELTSKGAVLVVKAPVEELESAVTRGVATAMEENAIQMAGEEEGRTGEEAEDRADKKKPAIVECSDDENQSEDEEEHQVEDEEEEKSVGHLMDVRTSQESSVSSRSSASGGSIEMSSPLLSFGSLIGSGTTIASLPAPPPVPSARVSTATRPLALRLSAAPATSPVQLQLRQFPDAVPQPAPPQRPPTLVDAGVYPPRHQANPSPSVTAWIQVPSTASVVHPSPVSEHQATPTSTQPLPADFEVPTNVSVAAAWEKWCCGDAQLHLPPFRSITHKQLTNKMANRRLSDLRCAMQPIEFMASSNGLWKPKLTPADAAEIFQKLQHQLPLCTTSATNKKKEIAWSTALNTMRRGKKRRLEERGGEVVDETML